MNISSEEIFSFISLISEASLDKSRWQAVLLRGQDLFGASASLIQGLDRLRPEGEFALINGYSEKALEVYHDEFLTQGRDIRVAQLRTYRVGQPFSDSHHFAADIFQTHDFYAYNREYADTQYMIGMKVYENASQHWGIGWNFHKNSSAPPPECLEVLSFLGPHLTHAVNVSSRLNHQAQLLNGAMDGLAALNCNVAVLDADLHVVFSNKPMDDLINSGTLLYHDSCGGLEAYDKAGWQRVKSDLLAVLKVQCRSATRAPGLDIVLRDRRGKATHLATATFMPADPLDTFRPIVGSRQNALLLIKAITKTSKPDAEKLKRRYQLTDAQALLARELATGTALKVAAFNRNISYGTARAHLLKIFEKTGVNRQADLIICLQDASLR